MNNILWWHEKEGVEMYFKRYLQCIKEQTKYEPTKEEIEKGRKELSKELGVDKKFIEFAFVWEPGFKNQVFLSYHVTDPASKFYKSTRNYKVR